VQYFSFLLLLFNFFNGKKRVFLWTIIPQNAERHQVQRILMRQAK